MKNRFGVTSGPGALLAVVASVLAAGGVRAATVQFVDSGGELAGQLIMDRGEYIGSMGDAVELENGQHRLSIGAPRDYTVVVPIDATLDATEYEIVIGQFQILNQNSSNATNEPLKNRASTLSRTDLITFK